jgi:hypothetical protein
MKGGRFDEMKSGTMSVSGKLFACSGCRRSQVDCRFSCEWVRESMVNVGEPFLGCQKTSFYRMLFRSFLDKKAIFNFIGGSPVLKGLSLPINFDGCIFISLEDVILFSTQ